MNEGGTQMPNRGSDQRRTARASYSFGRTAVMAIVLCLTGLALAQGRLNFEPSAASVGDVVTATATGLEAGTEVQLVWIDANASWNVADGQFFGIEASETRSVIAEATVAEDGTASIEFEVPEGFGYLHDVFLMSGDERVARQGFTVVPTLTIEPTSGPVGTPITVTMTGIGYTFWQSVWHLSYDGAHSGWLSAITTNGTATAVIPATGATGLHTLQVISGTHPVPYLNQQQSPNYNPAIPTVLSAMFEITDGDVVMPPDLATQELPRASVASPGEEASGPSLTGDHGSGIVGSPLVLTGAGFPAGTEVSLVYTANRGNRLSGRGWETIEVPFGTATTDAEGVFTFETETPDDLGGEHEFIARAGEGPDAVSASFTYTITPSVSFSPEGPVAPGEEIVITIKGVGWTETANIYTLLMDNGFLGYGCGFNSQGDVTIHLRAPGQSGWHFISLYPAIYQGELSGPGAPADTATANATYLQVPMLHFQDHPGEELPAFHIAFEVR